MAGVPHEGDAAVAAREGPWAAADPTVPVLHYMPARGRAEPIRLTLALVRQPWFEPPAEPLLPLVRCQLDSYPFRGVPRYVQGDIDLVQSMAILRHLGRKHGLYGADLQDAGTIDMVLEGVADLRAALKAVWVDAALAGDAVQRYVATVMAPEQQLVAAIDTPGPGLACLERLLPGAARRQWPAACDEPATATTTDSARAPGAHGQHAQQQQQQGGEEAGSGGLEVVDELARCSTRGRLQDEEPPAEGEAGDRGSGGAWEDGGEEAGGASGWLVGGAISIADIAVADLVDAHLAEPRLAAHLRATFPLLLRHWRRVMGQPGIQDYLKSANRHAHVFGVDWLKGAPRRRQAHEGGAHGE